MTLEELMQDERSEGFEEGKAEGLAEGLEKGRFEGLSEGLAQGMEKGLAEGKAKVLDALGISEEEYQQVLKDKDPVKS